MDAPAQSLSPWADTAKRRLHPLSADASADVCIVGAGIAGLTTAYCLAQKQVSVIVLDDGRIVEQGRHSELLRHPNGLYRRYAEHQLASSLTA